MYTDGPEAIKEWFARNSDRYLVGWCLLFLGAFFYLAFLAVLVVALARALSAGDYMTFLSVYPLSGVLAFAVSLVGLRTGLFGRPLAWFGRLVALLGLVATTAPLQHDAEGALTYVGYATLLAFLVWIAGVSIAMARAPRPSSGVS